MQGKKQPYCWEHPRKRKGGHQKISTTQAQVWTDWAGAAQRVREAQSRLNQVAHRRSRAEWTAWEDAVPRFHTALEAAYPPGFWDEYEALVQHNDAPRSLILGFLEANPYFYRSGYIKQKILRYLKQVSLSKQEKERLRFVVLAQVEAPHARREFPEYARLAIVLDSPVLRQELATIGNAKAHHVLALLTQAQHQSGTDKGISGS